MNPFYFALFIVSVGIVVLLGEKQGVDLTDDLQIEIPNDVALGEPEPSYNGETANGIDEQVFEETGIMITTQYDYTNHPLMRLLIKRESGGNYLVVSGGRQFTDTSTHPYAGWAGARTMFNNVQGELTRNGIKPPVITKGPYAGQVTTASGIGQMVVGTWMIQARKIRLYDFSPDTQRRLIFSLLNQIGALKAYASGDYVKAISLAGTQWSSLPTSSTSQGHEQTVSMAVALNELQSFA